MKIKLSHVLMIIGSAILLGSILQPVMLSFVSVEPTKLTVGGISEPSAISLFVGIVFLGAGIFLYRDGK